MIDGFHLLHPQILYGLLALPVAAWLIRRRRHRVGSWQQEIDPNLLPWLVPTGRQQRAGLPPVIWPLVLLALTVVAAAGPSLQRAEVPVFQRADAQVIVMDLSDSMRATDIQPSRAQRAQQKILDILAERDEGVTGLVAYAGDAHVVTPLTDDRRTIENLLPALTPDIMPVPGSDAEAALGEAVTLITAAGMANGRIVLITDGMPRFDPEAVAPLLRDANIELAILGVGTAQGAPMPLPEGGFLRDADGEIVVPVLDSKTLTDIATALDATYREVTLDNSDIDDLILDRTGALQGEVSMDRRTDTWVDQGYWLALLAALGLLPFFRRGVMVIAVAMLFAPADTRADSLWDSLWRTPDQQGAQALSEGDPAAAAQAFEDPAWRGTAQYRAGDYNAAVNSFSDLSDADSYYNLGNARALAGDLGGALAAYDRSLELAPDREDALRNREIIQRALEDQQAEQEQSSDKGDSDNNDQQNESGESNDAQQGDQDRDDRSDQQDANDQNNDQQGDQSEQSADRDAPQKPDQSGSSSAAADPSSAEANDEMGAEMQQAMERRLDQETAKQMRKFDQALEDQQKLEQWLRRVPDEPGGLLRNKFRYQAIQRLRNGEKPDEDIRW
ncbi:MAG: VWA domain-containing protein [Halieaceae bacterium]|jgi:Ca-activated chloride channel family protein|nr:VWA domain-containing protein [Halieaceae bacterium]